MSFVILPEKFLFSQSSLQDWWACKRRFQYRYLQGRSHPAPETDDQLEFERHMQRGDAFHQVVHQHLVGMDADLIGQHIDDEMVRKWWEQYLAHGLTNVPEQRHAETILTTTIGNHRVMAKYDLLAFEPGKRAMIVDWKTSKHRTKRDTLERRLQTVVYRYILTEAGTHYNGGEPLNPEDVEMVYWFVNDSLNPERFAYNITQYEADRAFLSDLVQDIAAERDFPKVAEVDKDRVCRYCVYRSLCWDDIRAGAFVDMDDMLDDAPDDDLSSPDIDLDQVAEIEF